MSNRTQDNEETNRARPRRRESVEESQLQAMRDQYVPENSAPANERAAWRKSPVLHRFVGGQFSAEGMMPWSRVRERLEQAQNYWLATTRLDARPHVVPVWGAWVDEALYFDGLPTNRWVRNIAANPAIAVHLESGDDVVIIEGMVEVVTTDEELGARIVAVYAAKYDDPFPEPVTRGIFRLRPRTARAWTENWEELTRWHFPER